MKRSDSNHDPAKDSSVITRGTLILLCYKDWKMAIKSMKFSHMSSHVNQRVCCQQVQTQVESNTLYTVLLEPRPPLSQEQHQHHLPHMRPGVSQRMPATRTSQVICWGIGTTAGWSQRMPATRTSQVMCWGIGTTAGWSQRTRLAISVTCLKRRITHSCLGLWKRRKNRYKFNVIYIVKCVPSLDVRFVAIFCCKCKHCL